MLCPGPVDTIFGDRAGNGRTLLFKLPGLLEDPYQVARQGYVAMMRGDLMVFSSLLWRLVMTFNALLPLRVQLFMSQGMLTVDPW